ncbi:YlbD family protein [Heyndrickxia oleronia]
MGNSKLHPSVEKFKAFVKTHPKIIQDVRNGNHTLQELYEEWYLLGEEDPYWEKFQSEGNETSESTANKKETKSGGWMNQIGNIIQRVDANQMQNHLNNLSQVIALRSRGTFPISRTKFKCKYYTKYYTKSIFFPKRLRRR